MSVKIGDKNLTENALTCKECTASDVVCTPEGAQCDCRATETTADSTSSSVAFFCIFSSCKKQIVGNAGKIVSFFGEHSFAVYILHCNNPLLSRYRAFFINLFTQEQLYAKFLVLLPNAVLIFVIGVFIDALYDLTAGKLFGKLADVLDKFLVKIYTKVRNRLQKEQSQSNL